MAREMSISEQIVGKLSALVSSNGRDESAAKRWEAEARALKVERDALAEQLVLNEAKLDEQTELFREFLNTLADVLGIEEPEPDIPARAPKKAKKAKGKSNTAEPEEPTPDEPVVESGLVLAKKHTCQGVVTKKGARVEIRGRTKDGRDMYFARNEQRGKWYLVSADKVKGIKPKQEQAQVQEEPAPKKTKSKKAKSNTPEPVEDAGGIERVPAYWPNWIKALRPGGQYTLSAQERQKFVSVMGSSNSPFSRTTKTEDGQPVLIYRRKRTSRNPESDGVTLKYYTDMGECGTVYRAK